MSALVLHEDSDSVWTLSGPLNVHSIQQVWQTGRQWIDAAAHQSIEVNLGAVTESDSASVALLIDWFRYAQQQEKHLHLHSVPDKMLDIIRVSNLQSILDVN